MLKQKLKNPIVLVHGLGAKKGFGPIAYFHSLKPLLESWGNRVFIADLAFWNSIEHRAQQLADQIKTAFPNEKVNILGHSMGGIDARYAAAYLNCSERIASITTMGTPNHGCTIVDLVMDKLDFTKADKVDKVLAAVGIQGFSHRGFEQLSTKNMKNETGSTIPDAASVSYYSVVGAIPDPVQKYALPVFWKTHQILKDLEGDNDGFVSVQSATHGELIGVYAMDHYRQIGHFMSNRSRQQYYKMMEDIFIKLAGDGH